MKPGCSLIAYLKAKPEKRDELLKILLSFVRPSREEAACIDYHLHVSNDDPNLLSSMKTGARARSSTSTCKRQY